jgi:hypothetical protein
MKEDAVSPACRRIPRGARRCAAGSILVLALCWAAGAAAPAHAAGAQPPTCASEPVFSWLDFWVGTWDVTEQGKPAGEDRVEKMLDGCAISETWTSTTGSRGYSLFYVRPASRTWRQVWVTGRALGRGGVKEKELVERLPDGGVRFQGEIPLAGGGTYLDRTTLTPAGPDTVHQVIETSTDGGRTWRASFDAIYARRH